MSEKMRHLYIASNVTVGVSFSLSPLPDFLGRRTLALCAAGVCAAAMVVGLVSLVLRSVKK